MQESALTTEISAPLPLRARGVLEILDVAIKLYRRYFWVLFGWSALVILAGFIPGVSYVAFLLTPLMIGATACCIAAAVRGQPVAFKQCWQFTQPRYWPMLGMYILAFIVAALALFGLILVCALVFGLGVLVFREAPTTAQIVAAVIGTLLLLAIFTIGGTAAMIWQSMVPIIVCMEADKAGAQALTRAYELLRGHWVRVTTLMSVLVLGAIALTIILGISGALLAGGLPAVQQVFVGEEPPNSTLLLLFGSLALLWVTMYVLWSPIFYITLTLFYLDIRIRKEALDLEWSAHVTAPQAVAPQAIVRQAVAPQAVAPQVIAPQAVAPPGAVPSPATAGVPEGTPGTDSPTAFAVSTAPSIATTSAATTPLSQEMPLYSEPPSSPWEQPPAEQPLLEQLPPAPPVDSSTPSAEVITCPHCGASAPATQAYCMRCGTLLKPAQ